MRKLSNKTLAFIITSAVFVMFIVLCSQQSSIAEWYIKTVYPCIAASLSFVSSILPFSLFDVFVTLYLVTLPVSIVLLCMRKIKLKRWLYMFLGSVTVIFIWFYMVWGIAYFRNDFYVRTACPKVNFDSINFTNFLNNYIDELNAAYTPIDAINFDEVDCEIENQYKNLYSTLKLPYPCGKRPVKRMIYESFITKAGVSGYFGPLFNEVHVNRFPLPIELPLVMAHEKAHQLGIASEAECNLYAYIICTSSNNATVRYSGYFEVLGYVLGSVRKLMPNSYTDWLGKIDPRIIADNKRCAQYWQMGISPTISNAQSKVYDTYLKTNKVKSGIGNYSEMLALLVSWHTMQKIYDAHITILDCE